MILKIRHKIEMDFFEFRYPDCGPSDVTQIVINKIKTLTQDVTGADLFGRLDLSE